MFNLNFFPLILQYQSMVANRSGGGNTVENRNDYTSENDDATPPSRNPSKQPQLNSTRPRTGLGGDEIDVSRSQSQPALLHTMTASSGASVTSAGATSKASKCSRSSKSRKLERRSSTSAMSTVATTAAIEAVTKAMQDCGGDVSKAALLLIQQQQQQQMTRSRDGVKRRSSRKEDRSDEFSVSVISEGTTGSSRARASSKKNRTSSRDLDIYDNINDEERSVNSGSTRNSRNASKKNERRPSDSSFRSGSIDNKGPLLDVGMKSKSDRGGALMPIEEEVLVRRGNRTGSKSSKGRVRIEEGRGNNESSRLDDVDSDGEPFGPPAIFCFWNKPAIRVPPSTSTSDTILSAKIHNDRSLCLIM